MKIDRPSYQSTPLSTGLSWSGVGGGYRYEEKLDGVWHARELRGALLVGELMRSGEFYAFDLVRVGELDISKEPLRTRLCALDDLTARYGLLRPAVGNGGEFLEAILARGGEGIVAKHLDAPFGESWTKCKRAETWDLIVTEKHAGGKSSVRVGELNGEDRGWVPCRAAFDSLRVGDVIEVGGYGLTAGGKIREPRFIRIRKDKTL